LRKFWIASAAAVVLVLLVLFLLLGPGVRRPAGEPVEDAPAALVEERGAPGARPAADLVPDAEEKKKEVEPEPADLGPPLLRGIVLGESTPLPGARVLLFAVRNLEKAIERLEAHVLSSGGIPDFKTIISIVREELEGLRRSALSTLTDEKGAFEFRRIGEGGYFVLTLADGWLFRFGDVASIAAGRTQELTLEVSRGGAIAGQVVGANGNGIAGVRVTAEPRPAGVAGIGQILRRLLRAINGEFLRGPFEATSGPGGAFTIPSLPPGLYDLAASVPKGVEARLRGVETGSLDALIYIGEGARVRGSFADEGGVPAAALVFQLDRQDDLIQLPLPLAGFTDLANSVHQWLGDGPLSLTAGGRGEFLVGPLSPGSYRISVNQGGLMPLVETFEVDWDQDLDLGVLKIDRGETIIGWVRSAEGPPLDGAKVVAVPMKVGFLNAGNAVGDVMSGRTSGSTDASGAFKLSGLMNGPYRLTATYPHRAAGIKRDARPGGEPVELVLGTGFTLSGRVLAKAGGAPLAGAKVEAGGVKADTDREGRFRLDGVVIEDSSATFMFFGMGEMDESRGPAASERRRRVAIKASKEGFLTFREPVRADSTEIRIELDRTAEIAGTVFDPDGKPAPGALLRLTFDVKEGDMPPGFDFFDPAMVFLAVTVADLEGKFQFKDFRGGMEASFRVVADHLTYARGSSEPFSLARKGDEPLEVEVRLQKGCRVHGTVTDGERPVAGAAVRLRRRPASDTENEEERRGMEAMFMTMAGLPRSGQVVHTNREGKFAHERILPGDYAVSAEMAGFIDSPEEKLSVGAGQEQRADLVLNPGGTIGGVVVDPEGNPLAQSRLRLIEEREDADEEFLVAQRIFGGAYKSARTASDGAFRLTGLPSVRFTLLADAKGYSTRELNAIEPGGKELSIELAPAAALWGRVADAAGGRPIKTFTVELNGDGVEDIPGLPAGGREHSNADGRFAHESLEAGTYHVGIAAGGYVPIVEEVHLSAGVALERTFLLVQGGRIRGTAVDGATGLPIDRAKVQISRPASQVEADRDAGGESKHALRHSKDRRNRRAAEREVQDSLRGDQEEPIELVLEPWGESVRADREGRFLLEGVPPDGTWAIECSGEEFIPEVKEAAAPAGGQELEVVFRLRRGLTVSGWVRDRVGNPIAGVRAIAWGASEANARIRKNVHTGKQGEFRIAGLEKGTYKVRVIGPEGTLVTPLDVVVEENRQGVELTVP